MFDFLKKVNLKIAQSFDSKRPENIFHCLNYGHI